MTKEFRCLYEKCACLSPDLICKELDRLAAEYHEVSLSDDPELEACPKYKERKKRRSV